MGVYVGFDPGGFGTFGWAVLSGDSLPLRLEDRGIADQARNACEAAMKSAGPNVQAIGIDAPLFWNSGGDRIADQRVRTAIAKLGSAGGTVSSVNSLRGACLIQGMMAALICREKLGKEASLTEAHPKALLWLMRLATRERRPADIRLDELGRFVKAEGVFEATDHERDAVLGAITAFAMGSKLDGWQDLYALEPNPMTPLDLRPGYWMPI